MPTYRLGPFRLDTQSNLLLREGAPIPLGRRAITLLRTLIERPGALASKDVLIEAAWPGRLVAESNLPVQIAALRRVLGETPGGDRWIETMPGRGYRFTGPVVAEMEQGAMAPPPQVDTVWEPAPTPRADAERRRITAMSCELIAVSGAAEGDGLEDLRDVVAAFQRGVSETADRHDGFIVSRLGNIALVLFGYPAARWRKPVSMAGMVPGFHREDEKKRCNKPTRTLRATVSGGTCGRRRVVGYIRAHFGQILRKSRAG